MLEAYPASVPALRWMWLEHGRSELQSSASGALPPPPPVVADPAPSSVHASSWAESFAPKLLVSKIHELKLAFQEQCPSEVLDAENAPSTRLLSHVYKQVASKGYALFLGSFACRSNFMRSSSLPSPASEPVQSCRTCLMMRFPLVRFQLLGGLACFMCSSCCLCSRMLWHEQLGLYVLQPCFVDYLGLELSTFGYIFTFDASGKPL